MASESLTDLGGQTLQQFERAKTSKFNAISDNFRLWPGISLELMEISTTGKRHCQLRSLPRRTKKLMIFGPLTTTVGV